ncbi:MACPF domain-containing protein-like [Iris pallida]|uniref:MACPF domain-containing protein-like n=1 Tax=Iris pallida TaxID=29817 RepID=A0AAX6HXU9_IRIPA|nr:MACPF domain-containing protein-like [Iris pallida]
MAMDTDTDTERGGGREDPIELTALRTLGLGFDLTNDFRLRFAKRFPDGRRLVELGGGGGDEGEGDTRDVVVNGNVTLRDVPVSIGCDKGDRIRFRSDVLEFSQMSELLNQKSSVQGKVPSGYFNALFDLSGAWLDDAKNTKHLAFDGYFISLYNLHLRASPLVLRDEVRKAVPPKWDPVLLAKFIKTFGTHIIVEISVGGQDVVCVKQSHSSTMPSSELKLHLEDLGDFLFSDGRNLSPLHRKTREGKAKVPEVFSKILQSNNLQLSSYSATSAKDGITVMCSKRGGDAFLSNHSKWLQTVPISPEAILFKFIPITCLLTGVPGNGYLSHAINLYLRYKPDPEDLQYFLEFQVPRQWAPAFNEFTLGPQRRKAYYPSLQFRFLGPKLQVNTIQVSSCEKPVVGLRLYLEGKKCNRLAIHVQHLSSVPSMLASSTSSELAKWHGSENSGSGFLEPVQWKSYARVCTSPVKHNPDWFQRVSSDGVFIVTGAQLITKGNWAKKTLHLRLLFTHIPKCSILKTEWARAPAATSLKGSFLTTLSTTFTQRDAHPPKQESPVVLNSGVYPDGPPVPIQSQKLLKFVDMAEVVKGPHDVPGHWLVIAAKLVREERKIGLHVKFALLNYSHTQS